MRPTHHTAINRSFRLRFVPSGVALKAQLYCLFFICLLFSWQSWEYVSSHLFTGGTRYDINALLVAATLAILPPLVTIITILALFRFSWMPIVAVVGQIVLTVIIAGIMSFWLLNGGETGFGAVYMMPFELVLAVVSIVHISSVIRYRRQFESRTSGIVS